MPEVPLCVSHAISEIFERHMPKPACVAFKEFVGGVPIPETPSLSGHLANIVDQRVHSIEIEPEQDDLGLSEILE